MKLEGSLDAFSLPDVFQLLSFTKKTGALHLHNDDRQGPRHGVVHVAQGAVTAASSDVARYSLARRLVGAGHVSDALLEGAVDRVRGDPGTGFGRVLLDSGAVDATVLEAAAEEQVIDAVFDMLRWTDGSFAFAVDAPNPDDLGLRLAVDDVVAEGRRRLESWTALAARIPSPELVLTLTPAPAVDPTLTRDEWALVSLVDGRRSVAELVELSGRGEYAMVAALAALVDRGLLVVPEAERAEGGSTALIRRQRMLAALEGDDGRDTDDDRHTDHRPDRAAGSAERGVAGREADRAAAGKSGPILPARPGRVVPERRPTFPDESTGVGGRPVLDGTAAVHRAGAGPVAGPIEPDPELSTSTLSRLIAGVRDL